MSPEKEKILEANATAWKLRAEKAEAELAALRDSTKFGHAILESSKRVNEQRERAEKAERERDEAKRDLQETTDSLAGRILQCASSQAREQELRVALRISGAHSMFCPQYPRTQITGTVNAPCDCGYSAALARPSDTSALREFGLRLIEEMHRRILNDEPIDSCREAIVDAVLGAPT